MRYPGGKGQAGVYQKIINLMPPHDVYIETHLGGGNILERKKPARYTIAIDADSDVIETWRRRAPQAAATFICGDARAFLEQYQFTGRELIYADPPYVLSTRRGGKIYRHEYTDEQHRDLVSLLLTVQASVMISGYACPLYSELLRAWRRIDFKVGTRAGPAIESLWLNFQPQDALHDYRYLGDNFRERERIKRKQKRWRSRLERLSSLERAAMMQILTELDAAGAARQK